MFLPGIMVRLEKWRWNLCSSSGIVNVDWSKVAFLRTLIRSSMIDRFPLLPVRGAPSEVFCLLSLLYCGSDLFPLVPGFFATFILFPFLSMEVGSTGARFGVMDIWFGVKVFLEDEAEAEGSRRRKSSWIEVQLEDGSFVKMKKKKVEMGRVQG